MVMPAPDPVFVPHRTGGRADIENEDKQAARPGSQVEQATPNSVAKRESKVLRSNDTAVIHPEK